MPNPDPNTDIDPAADQAWMRLALRLARRGLGRTAENPSVGCVIVRNGRLVARARTGDGGRPHAETLALERAGEAARGATTYVSLEPCSHWGRTPPCADALVSADVARVVAAMKDPDSRVRGRGLARLRAAGIAVSGDVLREEAERLLAGYLSRCSAARPRVTLKLATSLDGRLALADGSSRWITGPEARARGHLLRAQHDAILIGADTVRADDPMLSCRLAGLQAASPIRVVLDSRCGIASEAALVRSAREVASWVIATPAAPAAARKAIEAAGVELLVVQGDANGRANLEMALSALAERGVNSVLVEGGASVAHSFLLADLVDEIIWFRAPMLIGGDGRSALLPFGLEALDQVPRFAPRTQERVGDDIIEILERVGSRH